MTSSIWSPSGTLSTNRRPSRPSRANGMGLPSPDDRRGLVGARSNPASTTRSYTRSRLTKLSATNFPAPNQIGTVSATADPSAGGRRHADAQFSSARPITRLVLRTPVKAIDSPAATPSDWPSGRQRLGRRRVVVVVGGRAGPGSPRTTERMPAATATAVTAPATTSRRGGRMPRTTTPTDAAAPPAASALPDGSGQGQRRGPRRRARGGGRGRTRPPSWRPTTARSPAMVPVRVAKPYTALPIPKPMAPDAPLTRAWWAVALGMSEGWKVRVANAPPRTRPDHMSGRWIQRSSMGEPDEPRNEPCPSVSRVDRRGAGAAAIDDRAPPGGRRR